MFWEKVEGASGRIGLAGQSAGPLRRIAARVPSMARLGSFVDQAFQGFGNIIANALMGRSLTHEQFATLGVMIGVHFFAWGFHRSNIILPMIINASEAQAQSDDEDAWWWINLVSLFLIATTLAASAALFALIDRTPAHQWMVRAVIYAAMVSPALCAVEFGRRRLYQRGRGVAAALASGASSIVLLAIAFWVWLVARSPLLAACGWGLGGLVGALVCWIAAPARPVSLAVMADVWRRHRHFAFWQTMTALPYSVYTTTVVILVAAFSGPAAAAAFTASRTLINPAMAVVSAIDTLDKPRAARALAAGGLSGLHRSIRKTLITVLALTGPYLAVLAAFSTAALHLVFGATFQTYGPGVSLLCLAALFACLNQAPETALIVLKAGQAMFAVRFAAAVFAFGALWLGARLWGFTGCAAGLLLTNLVNFAALRAVERYAGMRWGAT